MSKPKTMAVQNPVKKVGLDKSKNARLPCSNLNDGKMLRNEKGEVKRVKIEKKQTKKTASNFDRCCFGEWFRTLKRTEAT